MNIETFHAIAHRLVADFERHDLPNKLSNLVAQLQNRMNAPAEPSYVTAADKQITELREILPSLEANFFPPLWKEYLAEMNSRRLIGSELLVEIEEILQTTGMTPSIAHTELKDIAEEITEDIRQLKAVNTTLNRFEIGFDRPATGTIELGVLIPRAAVHENLSEFGAELRKLARIFGAFREATHGDRPDIKLKTIASSEFSILCLLDWETAKLIAETVSKLIEGYKTIVDLKEKIQSLRDSGVPEDTLKPLADHANAKMESVVHAVSEEITTTFPDGRVQETRKKELRIEMRGALGEIATRIDKGFSFEIRPGLPEPAKDGEDPKQAAEREIQQQQYNEITAKQSTIQYLKTEGEPILRLPGLPAVDHETKKKAAG